MFSKMMEVTTSIGCSLNCLYCPQDVLVTAYKKTNKRLMMTYETFVTCIDKVPTKVDIHFSGMCEPWINSECSKMVEYASRKGHNIHIFTTLIGMKNEDLLLLKETQLETLILHIPDENRNSKFPRSEEYYDLLKYAIECINKGSLPLKAFSCHGLVEKKIEKLIKSIEKPIITNLNDRAGNLKMASENILHRCYENEPLYCRFCGGDSLDNNILLPDGSVYLCCMDYGLKYPLGNLIFQDYEEISEGELKKEYRERLKDRNKGMILCRQCSRACVRSDINE